METTRVLYCCRCGHPMILEALASPVHCRCGGEYFADEPPKRGPVPLVWTGEDIRLLRALRICIDDDCHG